MEAPENEHFLTPAGFNQVSLTDQGILHLRAKFLGGSSDPLRTSSSKPLLEKHTKRQHNSERKWKMQASKFI